MEQFTLTKNEQKVLAAQAAGFKPTANNSIVLKQCEKKFFFIQGTYTRTGRAM